MKSIPQCIKLSIIERGLTYNVGKFISLFVCCSCALFSSPVIANSDASNAMQTFGKVSQMELAKLLEAADDTKSEEVLSKKKTAVKKKVKEVAAVEAVSAPEPAVVQQTEPVLASKPQDLGVITKDEFETLDKNNSEGGNKVIPETVSLSETKKSIAVDNTKDKEILEEVKKETPSAAAKPVPNWGIVNEKPVVKQGVAEKEKPVLAQEKPKNEEPKKAELKKVETKNTEIKISTSDSDPFADIFGASEVASPDLREVSSLRPDIMEPIDMEEAVSIALRNNFEIQASGAMADGAKWDRLGAYLQYFPSLEYTNASGAEKSMPGSYNGPDGKRIDETTHHRQDRSLFVRQPLIDMAVVADIMKSKSNVSVAEAEKLDAQESTAYSTVSVFLQLIQAKKLIEISDEYQRRLNELRQRMQARFDDGGATNADLNRIQSRISVAEAARLEALGSYGINLSEFKRLTEVVPARFEIPRKLVPETPANIQEALDKAIKANPSYLGSLKRIDIAKNDRNKSFSGILPKLSVEYSNVFNYNAGGAAHGNPIDGLYPTQRDSRVMLVARWSLTGGTAVTSGLAGAAKVREMNFKAQDVRARIEEAMHVGFDSLSTNRKRIAVLKETYKTDKKVVEETEERFMQGANGSLFEILDGYDRLHNTKIELVRAVFAEAVTSYQIRLQMGELVGAVLGDKAGLNGE